MITKFDRIYHKWLFMYQRLKKEPILKVPAGAFMISKNEKTYLPVENYRHLSDSGVKLKYHEWIERIERHTEDLDIEARALYDMIIDQVMPLGMKYQKKLTESICMDNTPEEDIPIMKDMLIGLTMILSSIKSGVTGLKDFVSCNNGNSTEHSVELKIKIDTLKDDIDKLEALFTYRIIN
jgi:glutamine synthetase type III